LGIIGRKIMTNHFFPLRRPFIWEDYFFYLWRPF
jgi:hypothetical protein